jgi:hypothetical protein
MIKSPPKINYKIAYCKFNKTKGIEIIGFNSCLTKPITLNYGEFSVFLNNIIKEKFLNNQQYIIFITKLCYFEVLFSLEDTQNESSNCRLPNVQLKKFSYGDLYGMELTYDKNRIILKDYHNFFKYDDNQKLTDIFQNLNELRKEMLKEFNVDICSSRIWSSVSLSTQIYNKNYRNKTKEFVKYTPEEIKFICKSFYGKRFKRKRYKPIPDEFYSYKVNYLYHHIMHTKEFPIGKPTSRDSNYFKNEDGNFNLEVLNNFFGFISIEFYKEPNTDDDLLVLPYYNKDFEEIIYPSGIIKGVYFSEEIKLALTKNYIIRSIETGLEFEKDYVFKHFVEDLYKKKINATPLLKNICDKTLDKFCNKQKLDDQVTNNTNNEKENNYFDQVPITFFDNPVTESILVAYGRIYMYKLLNPLVKDLVYVNSDCFSIQRKLEENLLDDKNGKPGTCKSFCHNDLEFLL